MLPDENLSSLKEAGRRRLFPRITDPNWLVLRRRREIFCRWLEQLQLQNPRVLDVGGRLQPYRELIPLPCQYWSVDLCPSALVSAVASAEWLPFPDNSFDLVICAQMLEYALHPAQAVREIHRVLRPNGTLLLSAPSIFPRDSEHDAWRFFPAAFRDLLTEFSETEILPESGSLAGLLRTIAVFAHNSARYEALRFLLDVSLVPALNLLGAGAQKLMLSGDGSFTVNYSVRARK